MFCWRRISFAIVAVGMIIGVYSFRFSTKNVAFRSILATISRHTHSDLNSAGITNDDYVVGSFYRFNTLSEERVAHILQQSKELLSQWPITGTLLVAPEGINGQFALPVALLDTFPSVLVEIDADLFSSTTLNLGQPFSKNELLSETFPFKKLLIKRKKEVLTDNIVDSLDWNDAGPELSPEEWHEEIDPAKAPLLLGESSYLSLNSCLFVLNPQIDCRNQYESDLGSFEGAIPLNTSKFSDSWPALDQLLVDVPSDRRILTYCTGGIRCVKVNAYLKQKLGFQNIGRLEQGIIAYERWLAEQQEQEDSEDVAIESRFNGKNFLFDRRRLMDEGSSQQTGTVLEVDSMNDSDESTP